MSHCMMDSVGLLLVGSKAFRKLIAQPHFREFWPRVIANIDMDLSLLVATPEMVSLQKQPRWVAPPKRHNSCLSDMYVCSADGLTALG